MSVVEQPSYERENQGHVLQSGTPPITDACSHDSTFVSREQPSYERENQGHVLLTPVLMTALLVSREAEPLLLQICG